MATSANDFSIKTFTSKLVGGGALASLFQANITEAQGALQSVIGDFAFLCKAANFPTSSIDVTEISYMGRPFRVPGNRAAQDWTTTIYNDENFKLRNGFENWMELISSHVSNKRNTGMESINSYTGTLNVQQMQKTGGATAKDYVFTQAWPYTLAEITVDWDTNEMQTYDVTWAFSYWTSSVSGIKAK
jgi:hypothetical protein